MLVGALGGVHSPLIPYLLHPFTSKGTLQLPVAPCSRVNIVLDITRKRLERLAGVSTAVGPLLDDTFLQFALGPCLLSIDLCCSGVV